MDSVYMNNFRGFTDTTLPIRQVNFLVGENSTGKTSVLALLDLLSEPSFWLTLDFNTGGYEFGGYRDIVSSASADQTEFQIGLCKPSEASLAKGVCYMLHFRESREGLPRLVRFSQLSPTDLITVRMSPKQLAACRDPEPPPFKDLRSSADCFSYLQNVPTRLTTGYRVLSQKGRPLSPSISLVGAQSAIDLLSHKGSPPREGRLLPYPGLGFPFAGMAPIRTKPKRTYDAYTRPFTPEGEHTPYVIRERLSAKARRDPFKLALEAFGKESGLFQSVGVTEFGRDSASPFELTVTLNARALRVNSVGYGVSQILPIVVELLTQRRGAWLAAQQPEVHLHPKAQAAFGGFLFQVAKERSQTLLIETHSDYLLDRFRTELRESSVTGKFAQVVFFERCETGNTLHPMVLDEEGEYPQEQPAGFRGFFLQEQRRILGV